MTTLEDQQAQIDALRAFVGIDGYRAGQERMRTEYMARLQNVIAEAKVQSADPELPEAVREALLAQRLEGANQLKRWIDKLNRELGPGAAGNRATRRRAK